MKKPTPITRKKYKVDFTREGDVITVHSVSMPKGAYTYPLITGLPFHQPSQQQQDVTKLQVQNEVLKVIITGLGQNIDLLTGHVHLLRDKLSDLVEVSICDQVAIDSEWGSNRSADKLRDDGELPSSIIDAEVALIKTKG